MKNMGGIGAMLDKMPGMGGMAQAAQSQLDTKQFDRMEAMINSMTPKERKNPDLINPSRKRRITAGSGTVPDLNRLLKQHKQMQKMMKKMKGGGMQRMMRGMGGMMGGGGGMPPGGGLPPGFPGVNYSVSEVFKPERTSCSLRDLKFCCGIHPGGKQLGHSHGYNSSLTRWF